MSNKSTAISIKQIPLLQALSNEEYKEVLHSPKNEIKVYKEGEFVIREGEVGEVMYLIMDGAVEIITTNVRRGEDQVIATLGTGDFFGEEALFPWRDGKRNASVRALFDSTLFRIDKEFVLLGIERGIQRLCASKVFGTDKNLNFDTIRLNDTEAVTKLATSSKESEDQEIDIQAALQETGLFRTLQDEINFYYQNWTQVVRYKQGDEIIQQGQKNRFLYIIVSGSVDIVVSGYTDESQKLETIGEGQYFGQQSLLPWGSDISKATFIAGSEDLSTIRIMGDYLHIALKRDHVLRQKLRVESEQIAKELSLYL